MKLTTTHLARLKSGHEVVLLPYVTHYEGKADVLFVGHYLEDDFVCVVYTPEGECLSHTDGSKEIVEIFNKALHGKN